MTFRSSLQSLLLCALLLGGPLLRTEAQTAASTTLEGALSAVVTVAVYETEFGKRSLGFRGGPANAADQAYAKMLDLSGASGSGSGFIINQGGRPLIVTNAHVIEQAADKDGALYVFTINRNKYKARVIGGDSFYDLAILEFIDKPGSEISALDIRTDAAHIGEPVYAIGNPLGEYPYSVSEGIISARNRVRGGLTGKFGFLQTTATVIWGNSGGPLVDAQGRVVGINSQIAFAQQGNQSIWQPQINFALEMPIAKRLIDELLENRIVSRSYFGVELTQKRSAYSPNSREYGYYGRTYPSDPLPIVGKVIEGSPAAALKPYAGYAVTAIDGEAVRNLEEVLGKLEGSKAGQAMTFTVKKDGKTEQVSITPTALDGANAARIGEAFLRTASAAYTTEGKSLVLRFGAAGSENKGMNGGLQKGNALDFTAERNPVSLSGDWQALGIGYFQQQGQESMWRVQDLADVGTAARLTGLLGIVDIALFRKGSNPDVSDNYRMKRINLSGNDHQLQQTLWY
ncbi:MAG: PDZ domain-containing protein [Chitinophagaceae bacterium]|nr:MAG: PDZ domain-containing protein [Chitinophagaceae bacterium]